jgi:hypothetical protein
MGHSFPRSIEMITYTNSQQRNSLIDQTKNSFIRRSTHSLVDLMASIASSSCSSIPHHPSLPFCDVCSVFHKTLAISLSISSIWVDYNEWWTGCSWNIWGSSIVVGRPGSHCELDLYGVVVLVPLGPLCRLPVVCLTSLIVGCGHHCGGLRGLTELLVEWKFDINVLCSLSSIKMI